MKQRIKAEHQSNASNLNTSNPRYKHFKYCIEYQHSKDSLKQRVGAVLQSTQVRTLL